MSFSGNVRARRPASPPAGLSHSSGHSTNTSVPSSSTDKQSQRFPHPREEHLDADARRAAASKGFGPASARHGGKHFPTGGIAVSSGELKLLFAIVVVACAVRMFRLSKPNSVVFDEVHFGKFAGKYIKTQYYVDVHPPLAKLLITLAGWLFGYDGNFDFKDIGKLYENVPYVAMRMLPAGLGVATVPLAYLTLRALDCRASTALMGSLFLTFENGLITQSRHILLDSPLVFFTALTIFLWTGFCNEDKHKPFTTSWWAWLSLSGLSLGAVLSCKWVGLFTYATVGFHTVFQLWNLLGDLRITPRLWMRHFIARAICLILIPIWFYMAIFSIHFAILQNSGDGDGFMSSEFQHTLKGRGMADTFADVAIGSKVTIRHLNTQGGYLHSHPHNYPTGSKQQQITLYPHRDHNNEFLLLNATQTGASGDPAVDWLAEDISYVTSGARIKLRHIATEKHVHSHDHRPPVSDVDFQNEVSAYGLKGFIGDANDDWIVEIYEGDKRDKESHKRVRTLRTHFRLRHALQGCYLFSHKVKLPEWGYEQQEVTCNKNAVMANSLWFVETATNEKLPADAPKVNYRRPGFLSKFWELQKVMWTTNAGLTDRHTYDSRPDSWPLLRRGINFWVKDHHQIYLIGNPLVWYLSTLAVAAYIAVRGFLILRAKRGYRDFDNTKVVKYDSLCGFFFMGWSLHYFPFYLMQRQLFLHHYFPALYFAVLLSCGVFDLLTSSLRPRIRLQIAVVIILLAIWNFWILSPLAYGGDWTRGKCEKAKWLKTWDFGCNEFHTDIAQYNIAIASTPQKSSVPASFATAVDGNANHAAEESTSAISNENKAEPGKDAFQGRPADEVPVSSGAPGGVQREADVVKQEEEKIVSTVTKEGEKEEEKKGPVSAPAAEDKVEELKTGESKKEEVKSVEVEAPKEAEVKTGEAKEAAKEDEKKEEAPVATKEAEKKDTESASSSSSSASSSSTSTEAAETEAAPKKAAGPLDQVEMEAAKVAEELYPEAVAGVAA
ncbi:hypothetical protein D9611_003049 [Ephemerocybe angulata]|uniref:dolichyl-phosphate-mannose--protein mannosyltransferase n=1 Tax=Ephemerocybe angulata TaxID=980116 RepID=A0A8H5FHW9_9AGAR|nr:hypothetical protein D9611_003049 [Tulosesus angulatus]